MIDCMIVLGRERKPAQTFFQSTTHFACVKCQKDAAIKAHVDKPTTMTIEVDEEPVYVEDLAPGTCFRSLVDCLKQAPAHHKVDLSWARFSKRPGPEENPVPRHFKVVFRDPDLTHRIIATFDFALLECTEFQARHASYQHLRQPTVPEAHFPQPGKLALDKKCPHCDAPYTKGRNTCTNCGMPRAL